MSLEHDDKQKSSEEQTELFILNPTESANGGKFMEKPSICFNACSGKNQGQMHSDSSGHVLQLQFHPFQGRVDKLKGAEGIYVFVDFERGSQRCPSKRYLGAKLR